MQKTLLLLSGFSFLVLMHNHVDGAYASRFLIKRGTNLQLTRVHTPFFALFARSFASQSKATKTFSLNRIALEDPKLTKLVDAVDAHDTKQVQESLMTGVNWRDQEVYHGGGSTIAYAAERLKWAEDTGNFPVKRKLDAIMDLLSDDIRKTFKVSRKSQQLWQK